MRWALTGVCTSETVQTQKDKRCDRTSARDPGRGCRGQAEGGARAGFKGDGVSASQVKVLWGQQGTCT